MTNSKCSKCKKNAKEYIILCINVNNHKFKTCFPCFFKLVEIAYENQTNKIPC